MIDIEKETRGYHILANCRVRGTGSLYAHHPNRCLWDVCGKPMIQRVLEAVKGAKYIDKIAILTESEEIEEVVKQIGGVVAIRRALYGAHPITDFTQEPFKRNRPRSLLSVEKSVYTGGYDYLWYYLKEAEGYERDIDFQFGANTPLITSEIINHMIEKFFEEPGVKTVGAVYPTTNKIVYTINIKTKELFPLIHQAALEKQNFPPLFNPVPCQVLGVASKDIQGIGDKHIEILPEEGIDVHNEEDLFEARCHMKRRLLKEGKEVNWKIGQDYKHKV